MYRKYICFNIGSNEKHIYETKILPPLFKFLKTICLYFILVFASISCVEHQEEISIQSVFKDPKLKEIESWFKSSEKVLHPKDDSQARKTDDDVNLTFPFSEKELDWPDYHRFEFSDGREVYEVKTKNKTKIFPLDFYEKFGGRRSELYTETLLFIENPGIEKYNILIVRYYQTTGNPIKINYNNIRPNWTGSIDVFNYQEKHLRTFNFEKGKLLSHVRYSSPDSKVIGKSLNISCYTSITYLPSYVVCIGLDCTIYSGISVTKTECHNDGGGGGGSGPSDTFCDDTNCNEFPSPGSGFPLEEDDQIILDASFVEDENAECIWDKLMQIHGFQKIAGQFAGVKSEFDVVLKIGQTANSSATAQTQWMGNNSPIEITFNQNQMGRSALEVARTVLHEMLHADFYRAINTHSPTLSDISFKETFEEYTRQYAGDGAIHHNLMADRYINYMANILQEIHPQLGGDAFSDYMNYPGGYPNGIPRAFYEALAWDGLRLVEIKGWTNKTETEKSNIQMHINNAQSGRKSCGN